MKKRAASRRGARIDRRSFLRLGALGGLAAAARPVAARRALASAVGWDGHCCAVVFAGPA